jgi:hypothetical protein
MGFFHHEGSDEHQAYQKFQDTPDENKAELSHELISGAAAYEAAKAYEDHVAKNGKPDSHAKAKELLAGFAGAFIDRELETRGMDFAQREEAKYKAKKRAEAHVDGQY